MISRRRLLGVAALVPLAACAGQPNTLSLQQLASDAALIGSGLASILPTLSPLVDTATLTRVSGALATINQVAGQLGGMPSLAAAQTPVQQLEQAANAVLGVAAPLLAATPAGPVITAAAALLPVIEAAVGLAVPAQAGAMTPDEARAILRAAGRR